MPACWSRTRCSQPSIPPSAGPRAPTGRLFTLTDTVGFVRHLPTQLVEAFRSTLEEVADADLIVHVVDAADADPEAQIRAVREVLAEVDALGVPELIVFNKVDAAGPETVLRLRQLAPGAEFVSARTGRGIETLRIRIETLLPHPDIDVTVLVPYTRGDLVTRLHERAEVLSVEHTNGGTLISARVDAALAEALRPYAEGRPTPKATPHTEAEVCRGRMNPPGRPAANSS